MCYTLKQSSTAKPILIFMTDDTTFINGKSGLTLTVKISKNGGTGITPSGALTEIDATNLPGWYKIAGNATDTNTLGPLIVTATATGAAQSNMPPYDVQAIDVQDGVRMGLTGLANAVPGAAGGLATADALAAVNAKTTNLPADPADASDIAASFTATSALIGAVQADTDNIQTRLPAALVSGRIDASVGAMATNTLTASALAADAVQEILTTAMVESYAADGAAPTLAQAILLIQQTIGDFSISGTTITTKKLDGSTTAATYTMNDATTPTSRTRAS